MSAVGDLFAGLRSLGNGLVGPAGWLSATLLVIAAALLLRWLLARHYKRQPGWRFRVQGLTAAIALLALFAIILIVPDDHLRGQLLGLLGILLSAAIALSSTTLIGNAMAGFMLRGIGGFSIGDFIRVEDHFGRVTERGLLHTEIQTEDRDLISMPNAFLVARPVRVLRASGTVISCTVSLGYDVARDTARDLLLDAARKAGLEEPFVEIQELGDFSVTYRAAGLLHDVKTLLTVRSALRARILDSFHSAGVEIASPTIMYQRQVPGEQKFIPIGASGSAATAVLPEAVIFDKAEAAEHMATLRASYDELATEISSLETRLAAVTDGGERGRLEGRIASRRSQRERLGQVLQAWEKRQPGK